MIKRIIGFCIFFAGMQVLITLEAQAQLVPAKTIQTGMEWPEGKAFPSFAVPSDTLDGFCVEDQSVTIGEKVMFTVLQGLVNKTKPVIFLLRPGAEGMYKWPENLGLKIREYKPDEKWELIRKYQERISGVILYSVEKSEHYRNLACTAAGLKNALPVTTAEYEQLRLHSINLPVIENLSALPYETPEDIYRYLYSAYWKDCTKRLLISHSAIVFIRDIAAASGAAILWLDPRKEAENQVLRLFLQDMKAGESIILGWWAEERSGIGIGTEYGISTIPADFYENATVYAGMDPVIKLPVVPKKPELENK
ncbi:MAG: hypothetical protein LBN71_01460, partial [Tannerella sp.]|nr:hypothetical protein [Tannerella sp.]